MMKSFIYGLEIATKPDIIKFVIFYEYRLFYVISWRELVGNNNSISESLLAPLNERRKQKIKVPSRSLHGVVFGKLERQGLNKDYACFRHDNNIQKVPSQNIYVL